MPNTIQLIWPTVNFVRFDFAIDTYILTPQRNSLDGWASGGSLCFPAKNFKGFFRENHLFYKYESLRGRENVPPHIKVANITYV